MSLIPELFQIISEYSDPETYTNLKSLNIPVIKHQKYERLLSDSLEFPEELIKLKNKYLESTFKSNSEQNIVDNEFSDHINDITNQIKQKQF